MFLMWWYMNFAPLESFLNNMCIVTAAHNARDTAHFNKTDASRDAVASNKVEVSSAELLLNRK